MSSLKERLVLVLCLVHQLSATDRPKQRSPAKDTAGVGHLDHEVDTPLLPVSVFVDGAEVSSTGPQRPHGPLKISRSTNKSSQLVLTDYKGTVEYETEYKFSTSMIRMKSFYDFSRSVLFSSQERGYPYEAADYVKDRINDKEESSLSKSSVLRGFLSLALWGFLLGVFYLCHCLCFPCCVLCCKRCCVRPPRIVNGRVTPMPPKQKVFTLGVIILGLGGVMGSVSVGLAWNSVEDLLDNLLEGAKALYRAVNDALRFFNFFMNNVMHVFVNLNVTKDALFDKLDNVGTGLGAIIRNKLEERTGLKVAVDNILRSEAEFTSIQATVKRLKDNLQKINTRVNQLRASGAPVTITTPNFAGADSSIDQLSKTNLSQEVNDRIREVDRIQNKTMESATSGVAGLRRSVNDHVKSLSEFEKTVADMRKEITESLTSNSLYKNYDEIALEDQRDVAKNLALVCLFFVLLLVLLISSGTAIVLMAYSQNYDRLSLEGMEEGCCLTVSKGCCVIYWGVFLFSLTAALTAVLGICVIWFMTIYDVVICQAVSNPQVIDELMEKRNLFGEHPDGSYFSTKLLTIKSNNTFGTFLSRCKDDMALFEAADIGKSPSVNFIYDIDNMIDKVNVSQQLGTVNFSLGPIDALSTNVTSYLDSVPNLSTEIPFKEIDAVTSVNVTAQLGASAALFQTQVNEITSLQSQIHNDSQILQRQLTELNNTKAEVISSMRTAQGQVGTVLNKAITEGVTEYAEDMKDMLRIFIKKTRNDVTTKFGKCRLVYNIYKIVLVESFCNALTLPGSGVWMALGWVNFFMLLTIILAKRLVCMIPKEEPRLREILYQVPPPLFLPLASPPIIPAYEDRNVPKVSTSPALTVPGSRLSGSRISGSEKGEVSTSSSESDRAKTEKLLIAV